MKIEKNAVMMFISRVSRRSHNQYSIVTAMIRRLVTNANHRLLLQYHQYSSEIPQARGLPLIGTTLALIAEGSAPKLHIYIDKRHKQLGPVFKDKIGPISAVFVADPEEMRSVFAQEGKYPKHMLPEAWTLYNRMYGCSRGLFFMDGEEWLHYRKILNRLLLKENSQIIEDACRTVSEELVKRIEGGIEDLEQELYRWSLNVITATLLGANDYNKTKEHLSEVLEKFAKSVSSVFECSVKLQLIPAVIAAKLQLSVWKRFVNCVGDALNASTQLVTSLLKEHPESDGILRKMLDEQLQQQEIVKLVADLILAAGDTTAYTMEWLLYLIARNQEIQKELRNALTLEPFPVLLKNCVKETLRLYPVAPFITRYLPTDSTISGYNVPKDTLVIMSLYTISRDPKYFRNPEVFMPERWLRSDYNNVAMMQQASLPFAMGARSCIGRKIAEMQLQLALAYLVRNYHIKLCEEREVEMVLKMVAVPKDPVRLQFNKIV